MKIAGMTLIGLLAGVLIGGCCYFICDLAHIKLIYAYLLAAVIDVAGFIVLYKRYEQQVDAPQDEAKIETTAPEPTPSEGEPQPSETPEEVLA